MKILISVGQCEKELLASTKIALNVFSELNSNGISCEAFGISDKKEKYLYNNMKVNIIEYEWKEKLYHRGYKLLKKALKKIEEKNINKNDFFSLLSFFIIHPVSLFSIIFFQNVKITYDKKSENKYVQELKKIFYRDLFTDVVCLQEPSWSTNAVFEKLGNDKRIRLSIYQVDPYGLQTINLREDKVKRIQRETENFKCAKFIFTTPQLYNEYLIHDKYNKYIGKMFALEFPNIYRKEDKLINFQFDDRYINILYSGSLFENYRNPDYILDYFSHIIDKHNEVRCFFQGNIVNKNLNKYLINYPNNYFVLANVSVEESYAIMYRADFLLNIGNTIHNMVPSKIFDYFSMGKPIINVQKLANCPAKPYFDKYPLAFTVKEYENERNYDQLYNFIIRNKTSKVCYTQIEKMFEKNTISYVTRKILTIFTRNGE